MQTNPRSGYNFVKNPLRRMWKRLGFIIGIGLLSYGILQISWNPNTPHILVLVDTSLSMNVRDIAESDTSEFHSRLDAAKSLLKSLNEASPYSEAIVTYARMPKLETPFTTDTNHLDNIVDSLTPILYGGGSDLVRALEFITNIYGRSENTILVVLTDGEFIDTDRIPALNMGRVEIVGIGSEKGGFMLQGYDSGGKPLYRQYNGKNAISSLDRTSLEKTANILGAELAFLTTPLNESDIIREIIASLESSHQKIPWTMIVGAIILIASLIFHDYSLVLGKKSSYS